MNKANLVNTNENVTVKPSNPRANYIDKQIGLRLKELRFRKGVSQMELAKGIGVTCQQIQKYEKGINRIAISTLYAITDTLEIDIPYFLLGVKAPQGSYLTGLSSLKRQNLCLKIVKNIMEIDNDEFPLLISNFIKKLSGIIKKDVSAA